MNSPPGDSSAEAAASSEPPPPQVFTEAQARKRELRIGAVAIVVTGLVSAAGVFVSWRSAEYAQQTAREAQRETARAERERTDLVELRSVLDHAAGDLNKLQVAAFRASDMGYQLTAMPQRQTRAQLDTAVEAALESQARLKLRLGAHAEAVKLFDDAYTEFWQIAFARPDKDIFTSGVGKANQFIDEAQRLMRLRLPE